MKTLTRKLISSLDSEPEKWSGDRYTIDHAGNGSRIWIGNWWPFCTPLAHGTLEHIQTSAYGRWRLWRATKRAREAAEVKRLAEQEG